LIDIATKGQFLLNVNVDWLEPFKEATTDKIINTLITFAESFDIKSDPDFILNLADCVLNFDTINEEAVKFKCKAYSYKGNHSLALSTFKKFQKEYKYLYAQDYPLGFNKILES
jgi:DNA-binding SARP family transcriptional activator